MMRKDRIRGSVVTAPPSAHDLLDQAFARLDHAERRIASGITRAVALALALVLVLTVAVLGAVIVTAL